jgi:predicted permease
MKWLKRLFSRRRLYGELSEEIQEHLEEEIEELVASGMPRKDAAAAARRDFGNVTFVEESSREVWRWAPVENLFADVRYAVRTLRKSPGFTLVVILTLALGIGASTAIFSLIDAVMLRMLHVQQPDALLQVKIQDPRQAESRGAFTNPLWEHVRDQQDVFSDVFAWSQDRFDLAQGGAVHMAHGLWVSGDFFVTLGLRPSAGRLIAGSDDHRGCPAIAVLSFGFWQEHYGGANTAIGSALSLNRHPFQVIGIGPRDFYGMELGDKFDVALPICAAAIFDGNESRLDARSHWWLQVAGRTRPGVGQAQVSALLKVISPAVFTAALPDGWSLDGQQDFIKRTLTAVPAATGISEFGVRRRFERPLNVLMAVVGLVMLIACANIAGLMLARAAARHKEIAVRQALGASRVRLICQLLTECVLLSSAGALLGILFARWATALLVRYMSTSSNTIFLDLSSDARVLGFTGTVAVLTAMLFGLLPALRSTRVSLVSAMKGSQTLEIERPLRFRTRKWIVTSQVALSLVLLVAAGLLLRSFAKLVTLDIGFDRNNVLLVGADLRAAKLPQDQLLATYETIENRLRALPGVLRVGRSMISPLEGGAWSQIIRTGWSKGLRDDEAQTWFNSVSPGYFETLRTPLLSGRNFTRGDTNSGPKVAIINQTLARRFFPGLNPIGKTFRIQQISGQSGPPIEIVGLVKDAKYESVREDTHPTAFFPDAQPQYPELLDSENFELRTLIRPSAIVSSVQVALAGVNKGIPLEFDTLAEQVNDSMIQERLLALLSGFFGALALLLAMIGLYGTLSYLVSQRQTEFGIRMALGAQPSSILLLVSRDVVTILGGGIAVGGGISLATVRVLQGLLFGLPARDVVTLTAATCILSGVALVAGYLPARRAATVDPMVALRYE